ncbi:MAG TPA: pirin family protein [Candidatus Bathyarchaeia archaeon]|nr:pirin family protein [Candidatus Bathyarchaeia archaeon]
MIRVIKEQEQYKGKNDWLTTYHHFSFAEYYDPSKVNYGPLRVFNDDVIQPGTGFDFHQHQDMEIVTYVIDGILEHKDSLGNHGIIQPGEIQRMSAGTGVFHSEFNHSNEKPLRLLQIWLFSDTRGLRPSWEQRKYTKNDRKNKLLPVISPNSNQKDRLAINQDATFYISDIETGKELSYITKSNRITYLFVIEGKISLNGKVLYTRDIAQIENEEILKIKAQRDTELILIDLPIKFVKNSEPVKII